MKKSFNNRLEGIDWIAENTEDEARFEVLREQLTFNHIYTGKFFLKMDEKELTAAVVWLEKGR